MVAGPDGVSGLPAARPAVKELSPVPVPVRTLLLSMADWIAKETAVKSVNVLNVTAPSTVNGCPSLIGQSVVRAVTRVPAGERGNSSQPNMAGTTAKEIHLR